MHAVPRQPTARGEDTLAQRYEHTLCRLVRRAQPEYQFKVQWKCEFDFLEDMQFEESISLRTRDALYGEPAKALRLHYKENRAKERHSTWNL